MSVDEDRPSRETGRRVTDALRRALSAGRRGGSVETVVAGPRATAPPVEPDQDLEDETTRRILRHIMGPDYGVKELGPYIRPPPSDGDQAIRRLGGGSHLVAFRDFQVDWLESLDEDRLEALTMLADMGLEAIQALRRMARREIERRIVRKAWRRARWIAASAATGAFFFAQWAAEKIEFFKEKGPVFRDAWKWLLGFLT